MFSRTAGIDAAAYEYDAHYQPQPTDDRHYQEPAPRSPQKRPNYRPTPLRWYFIVVQIVLLIAVMGLVVWARIAMPDSDNAFTIIPENEKRWINVADEIAAIQTTVTIPEVLAEPTDVPYNLAALELRRAAEESEVLVQTSTPVQEVNTRMQMGKMTNTEDGYLATTTFVSTGGETTVTIPGTTGKFTTEVPVYIYETYYSNEGAEYTTEYEITVKKNTTVPITITQSASVSTVWTTWTGTNYNPVPYPTGNNVTQSGPLSEPSEYVSSSPLTTFTVPGSEIVTETEVETDVPTMTTATITETGDNTGGITRTVSVSYSTLTGTTTKAPSTYVTIGKVTITQTYRDPDPPKNNPPKETKPPKETVVPVVTVKKDETVKQIKQVDPVTIVKSVGGEVQTIVPTQGQVETVVSQVVPGVIQTVPAVTTDADGVVRPIVTTGADGIETPVQIITTANQLVMTVPAMTTDADGVVRPIVTTGPDGIESTVQVLTTLGGQGFETTVPLLTTDADGVVRTVVTTGVDGLETPVFTVSTVGGSLVTTVPVLTTDADGTVRTVVTTGTDGLETPVFTVSTISGSLITFTRTRSPTAFVTTRSGKLTTITSSGTQSTTIISTRKGTTRTFSSTATVMPTSDPSNKSDEKVSLKVIESTDADYFLGKFLPPILAVLLAIPLRIIDHNVQLYQPFYAMNQPTGALGPSSMNLHFDGWVGFIKPFSLLSQGSPVPFITMLIVWGSALMTPLATEAIGMKIHGRCKQSVAEGCAIALGVSPMSTHALLALMGLIIVLLCALLFYLRNWETGLYANPWSIAGITSLATNRQIRPSKTSERKIEREMADKRYGFGYFENVHGQNEYGIVLYDDAGQTLRLQDGYNTETSSIEAPPPRRKRRNPFMALGWAWRGCFIAFLLGLVTLVLYYHLMPNKQTSFMKFMNGQTFGIRFLFATFGVVLIFGWTALFISVAMIGPYQRMSKDPQLASDSILITRPTNGFSGLWAALKHRQIYPGIVALMAILSEFMPILLANVPFGLNQTKNTHNFSARVAAGILFCMLLTMIGSFFIKWPHMPVDPRSVAGAMYYVGESNMVDQFSGLASVDKKEREKRVKEMGGRYWFGEILTKNGATRVGVERDDGVLGVETQMAQRYQEQYHEQHQQGLYEQQYPQGYHQPQQQQQQPPNLPVSPTSPHPHNIDTTYYGYQP